MTAAMTAMSLPGPLPAFHFYIALVDSADNPVDSAPDLGSGFVLGGFSRAEGLESEIRMTAADAVYAAQWQQRQNFKLDMVFNAGAGEDWKAEHGGTDAMTAQLLADRAKYRWINHTYKHPFLGCVQDTSADPWKCALNAQGQPQ